VCDVFLLHFKANKFHYKRTADYVDTSVIPVMVFQL